MNYTVNDVAKKTGLSTYTIRYYAKEGLLPMVERCSNGTRLFKESDLESIYMIECMKRCNMSIKEIRDFTNWTMEGDSTIDKRLKLFQDKQSILECELVKLQETLDAIKYKQWFYSVAKEAGTVSIHDSLSSNDIPKEMFEVRARMKEVSRLVK